MPPTHIIFTFTFNLQLIIFFSKQLLRHPQAKSAIEDITGDTHFQRYLPEPYQADLVEPENIRRHIFCTGP
jgi:2-oxoglutarate dehydrogenase E1 component